jgi:hypothetical protein
MSAQKKTKSAAFRASLTVALILAVATVIEYFVALAHAGAAVLMLIGLLKAYFVVNNYMHISRLWSTEEGH